MHSFVINKSLARMIPSLQKILLRSQSDFAICWKSPIPGILRAGQWIGVQITDASAAATYPIAKAQKRVKTGTGE